MKQTSRRAGASTYAMADRRRRNRIWFAFIILGIVIVGALLVTKAKALGIGGLGIFAILVVMRLLSDYSEVRDRKMYKQERRAIRGAKGEEKVGEILAGLGEGFLAIHDVESPYGNIDHIIISEKGGVFLLETKAHGGRVSAREGRLLVNGHDPEKDFIAQALKNTYWLRDRMSALANVEPWISPVLVFTNAFVDRTAPIKGVQIVNKKFLPDVLRQMHVSEKNAAIWSQRDVIIQRL